MESIFQSDFSINKSPPHTLNSNGCSSLSLDSSIQDSGFNQTETQQKAELVDDLSSQHLGN